MGDKLPLGVEVDWTPVKPPSRAPLLGSHVLLRPVDAVADAEALYAVSHPPEGDPAIWTYLPYGPYEHPDQMRLLLDWAEKSDDPLFFALVGLADERPAGLASYLRITPEFGVIEIGHIWFGTPLQRTTAATEAIYLLSRHAFDDLGYRRLEWKCNALNVSVTACRRALWLSLRGRLSQPHGGQGPKPGHRLVRDHRRGMAGHPARLRGVARSRELRTRLPPEAVVGRADGRDAALNARR